MGQETQIYGLGRRKTATAQVQLHNGSGEIKINQKDGATYLQNNPYYLQKIWEPLTLLDLNTQYDIVVKTKGGGLTGQTDAITLGIARAILNIDPNFRTVLKTNGLLKRDARIKERKKYGLKKARKASQFSKR